MRVHYANSSGDAMIPQFAELAPRWSARDPEDPLIIERVPEGAVIFGVSAQRGEIR